jgi:hypothetical protein
MPYAASNLSSEGFFERNYASRIMRRMKGDIEAAIGLFVVLIVALVIVAIVAAAVFIPWQKVTVNESKKVARTAGIENICKTQ